MTTYYVVAKTKNQKLVETIQDVLNGIDSEEVSIETHEAADDPGAEEGKLILWYFSDTHKKIRYYAGPPPGPMQKPLWSYEKKDAVKLSEEACTITKERLEKMGIHDPDRCYRTEDLAPGKNIIFSATGVTRGDLLRGVRFFGAGTRTESLVMSTIPRYIRFVDTLHVREGDDVKIRF